MNQIPCGLTFVRRDGFESMSCEACGWPYSAHKLCDPPIEQIVSMSESHLRKLFEEVKSHDLTQSVFEQEKTKRIVALCDALKSCVENGGERQRILTHLTAELDSEYVAHKGL